MDIKQIVYEFIAKKDYVSFSNIERLFVENEYDFKGDIALFASFGANIMLWDGWTNEAFNILTELANENRVYMQSCSEWIYLIDGGKVYTLPVASQVRKYKNVHWLPVVYRPAAK